MHSNDVSSWSSCTRTLRSRQKIAIVDTQLVQLIVLDSTVQMVPGIASSLPAMLTEILCEERASGGCD